LPDAIVAEQVERFSGLRVHAAAIVGAGSFPPAR
jgi:hypothetical protein